MATQRKGKGRTAASIRISPFSLNVEVTKKGFILTFRGLAEKGEVIEVHIECPEWWIEVIGMKLFAAASRKKKGT